MRQYILSLIAHKISFIKPSNISLPNLFTFFNFNQENMEKIKNYIN